MLMAVEMWVKRDHDAEWKQWTSQLNEIARRVSVIDGVTTSMAQPNGLSNRTPSLRVFWDPQQLGTSGEAIVQMLNDTEPRIALSTTRNPAVPSLTGISVTPYMLLSPATKRSSQIDYTRCCPAGPRLSRQCHPHHLSPISPVAGMCASTTRQDSRRIHFRSASRRTI